MYVELHGEPRWAGSHVLRFDDISNAVLLLPAPPDEDDLLRMDCGGSGPSSILFRRLGKLFTSTFGAAYTANRTEEPKNRPGDIFGKYSSENVPPKACSHDDEEDVDTGNTVQNP